MATPTPSGTRALVLRLVLAVATLWFAPHAVQAQSPVAIGAPLTGEVVLNRDIEVRIGPSEDARIVMTLKRGRGLNALGTPRGTYWTEVAIGGQPIGYVPADSLDSALMMARPPTGSTGGGGGGGSGRSGGGKTGKPAAAPDAAPARHSAATVPRGAWETAAQAPAQGYVVASQNIAATEIIDTKRKRPVTLRRGDVMGVIDTANGHATLALPGRSKAVATVENLIGVVAPYPTPGLPPLEPGPLFAARMGEYANHTEGLRAWKEFTNGPGAAFRDLPPMVWPVFRGTRTSYETGFGPLTRPQAENVCGTVGRQGQDCRVIELDVF